MEAKYNDKIDLVRYTVIIKRAERVFSCIVRGI